MMADNPRRLRAGIIVLAAAFLMAAGAEALRLSRSIDDEAAELRVEHAIGATVERKAPWRPIGASDDAQQVVVTSVAADSPARASGLQAGDTILAADRRPVESPADLAGSLPPGTPSLFMVDRQGARLQLTLRPRGGT